MGQIFVGIFSALLLSAPVIGAQDDGNRMAVIAAEFKSAIEGMTPQEVAGVANEYFLRFESLRKLEEEGLTLSGYKKAMDEFRAAAMEVLEALKDCGDSLLHRAVLMGDAGMVATIVSQRRVTTDGGRLPYDGEPESLHLYHIYYIAGSNLNVKDDAGQTPLHYAVRMDNVDVTGMLLNAGANPNVKDNAGQTSLHCVARIGNIDMAGMLLIAGADPNIRDSDGRTPRYYAVQADDRDMVAMLRHQ